MLPWAGVRDKFKKHLRIIWLLNLLIDFNHDKSHIYLMYNPIRHNNTFFDPKYRQQSIGKVFHDFNLFYFVNKNVELNSLSSSQRGTAKWFEFQIKIVLFLKKNQVMGSIKQLSKFQNNKPLKDWVHPQFSSKIYQRDKNEDETWQEGHQDICRDRRVRLWDTCPELGRNIFPLVLYSNRPENQCNDWFLILLQKWWNKKKNLKPIG